MKRKIGLAFFILILCMTTGCKVGETEVKEAGELYAEFIEKVTAGFEDGFQSMTTEELDISVMFNYVSETMGYYIIDLDNDGTDELLLGEDGGGAWANTIYDVYTVKDGKIVHVVDGWDRNRYYLCDKSECVIVNEGSSGAANSVYAYYRYHNGSLELIEAVIYDGWKDEENPWFYSNEGTTSENASSIMEEDAKAIIEGYSHKEIEYTPFLSE